jgi:branched-subunit amino acid aminotransferase/4-amino-4-deoxychorismate lyase
MTRAYLNGNFIPAEQLTVPVYDTGFVLGATVAEQLRTFGGSLFRLDRHLERLAHSLEIVGVDTGLTMAELGDAACRLVRENHAQLNAGDDLGLSMFVTPGPYSTMTTVVPRSATRGPTVAMHTYPLPFALWAGKYQTGQSLVTTDVQQVPATCWPAELKCRSRMHYYMADSKAMKQEPGARALMLDTDGLVLEASTANIFIYTDDAGIVSPPREKILPGVSVSVVFELAQQMGIPVQHRDLTLDDLFAADELMLSSTSPCVWPVTRLDGRALRRRGMGPLCQRLLDAWSDLVGIDIVHQATAFADRA